jgi:transposase
MIAVSNVWRRSLGTFWLTSSALPCARSASPGTAAGLARASIEPQGKAQLVRNAARQADYCGGIRRDQASNLILPMAPTLRVATPGSPQVLTPGQNIKHYLAGALHAHTGRLVWVEHPRKNSTLFVKLLEALRRSYRAARRIVLILDNYIVHKGNPAHTWLAAHPKFRLLFQPTYSPWVNQIERLWKTMHDTVTRNHRCTSFRELAQRIIRFLDAVQPFPGNHYALATV